MSKIKKINCCEECDDCLDIEDENWCDKLNFRFSDIDFDILSEILPNCPLESYVNSEVIEEKLHKIKVWCKAYPVSIFPEPDLEKMAQVLKDNGMTIDSIGASSMRHVLKGILEIIEGRK